MLGRPAFRAPADLASVEQGIDYYARGLAPFPLSTLVEWGKGVRPGTW